MLSSIGGAGVRWILVLASLALPLYPLLSMSEDAAQRSSRCCYALSQGAGAEGYGTEPVYQRDGRDMYESVGRVWNKQR